MTDTLNPAQREAVRYLDGPCLVIAGAGSGKTRVITQKIVHMMEGGVTPRAIAAITFTNKAAKEMADRLGSMVKLRGANVFPEAVGAPFTFTEAAASAVVGVTVSMAVS